jgi:hypothetical protein
MAMEQRKVKKTLKEEEADSIWLELIVGFIGIFFGSITSKTRVSLLFILFGILFLALPISGITDKPAGLYIFASIFILIGIIILIIRIKEMDKENIRKKINNK